MKKLILVLIAILVIGSSSVVFAEKPTNWVDLQTIGSGIYLNYEIGDEYYPVAFYFDGMAKSEDGGQRRVVSVLPLGTPGAIPFILHTLAGQRVWYQALPTILKPVAKDLREQATAEDISVQ